MKLFDIRKEYIFISIILCAHLVLTLAFLQPGVPKTHDGTNHIVRIAAYKNAIADGHIPPRWAALLNYSYGSPVFNFFYQMPYLSTTLLSPFIYSYETLWKVINMASFILAGVFFYGWMRMRTPSHYAMLGSLLYGLAPYHFLNLYVRGDIGELFAYMTIPLIGLFGEILYLKKTSVWILPLAFAISILILSHHGVAFMMLPVLAGYFMLLSWKDRSTIIKFIFAGCFGLLVTTFFWLPALIEQQFIHPTLSPGDMFRNQFASIGDLILFRWGFADSIHSVNGMSPQIGVVQLVMLFWSLIIAGVSKNTSLGFKYWLVMCLFAVYMTSSLASFVWQNVPLMKNLQFPWRFVGLTSLAIGWLGAHAPRLPHQVVYFISFVLIVLSLPLIRTNGYIHFSNAYYEQFVGSTFFHGEATPIWTAGDPGKAPQARVEVIAGEAKIHSLSKTTTHHRFLVEASTAATILDNTLYYPGWVVYANKNSIPIQFQDPSWRGLITFEIPKGISNIEVVWKETRLRKFANLVSLITCLVLVSWGIIFYKLKRVRV